MAQHSSTEGTEPHAGQGETQTAFAALAGFALTVVAGWVDAVGFLRLGGLYPSFMSGNTTQLGIAVAGLEWAAAAVPAALVALFVLGAFTASMFKSLTTQWALPACFALQSALLALALLLTLAGAHSAAALMPLPLAMGLQNVAARAVGAGSGITFVTGTLVRLGEALAGAALRGERHWRAPLLTWLAMATGAAVGTLVETIAAPMALLVPLTVAAVMAGITVRRAGTR
jgi:uncharacterized membrane protein YoaK (UPF0700 family)